VLFSVDLQALQKYLNPNKKKLESKGVSSVIGRVMNLSELYPTLSHEPFCKELESAFQQHYNGTVEREVLEFEQLREKNAVINSNYERLKSWEWLYGQCPEFKYSIDRKFDWGMTEVTYNVQDGLIQEGKIYSDCLFPDFISAANEELNKKVRYDR
jgi:lipoate---protein ligase